MKFACIKHLEIIGEASNHISGDIKEKFKTIEWSQVIGMRNVLVHEYSGVDSRLVWEIIKNELPDLKENVLVSLYFANRSFRPGRIPTK